MTDGHGERPSDRAAAHPSLVPAGRDLPGGPVDLVEQPGWRRLLAAARRSLERSGGRLDTTVTLSVPTDDERLVIIGITGIHRSAAAARLSIRLGEVDEHLRGAHGVGLVEVLTMTAPLRNRPSDRTRESVARDAVLAAAHEGRHAGTAWYAEWLDGLRRDGTLTRIVRAGLPFEDVVRVLDALPAADEPIPVFADRVLDDTKALTGGPLRGLVLRAVAIWQQTALPVDGERERALWESVGLVPDDLASQVLVLNVRATGGLVGRWLTEAAQAGVPMRVTLHQLRLAPLTLDCNEVYVCENPAVLRAASTTLGAQAPPLICTEGVPSAAVHTLLGAAHGAAIRWRNDFDWTGVRLTAAALQRYRGVVPWRMTAADYLPRAGTGTALIGTPTRTPWDESLGESMRRTGRAVMEERLLDLLIADLRVTGAG
ncbi:TIGR02679 family protein [Micromonospora sp. HNM0581]|uniref:TIGR02679 family protein n=1 Tax=Micromonospora sp. HNM0581 TaxID=2716341 RepID=UPI00146BF79D|nr:TIGR02679 family protein [Micromonospora sp. HNM0581]NLU79876.1 TIGR02679 family protein [Micromonospora sp. HNM0581]